MAAVGQSIRGLTSIETHLRPRFPLVMAEQERITRGLEQSRPALPTSSSHASGSIATTSSNSLELISTTTTTFDSLDSTTSRLRSRIKHRIHSFVQWRRQHEADPNAESHPEISWPTTPARSTESSSNESLIAGLDALALSQTELELLKRMKNVCRTAQAAREKQQGSVSISDGMFDLRLRGGGDDGAGPRRRTTLPPLTNHRVPRQDSDRPSSVHWWLAGGKRSQGGQVPTIGELRVRKEVEQANRRIIGFWGTVMDLRRVGKVGLLEDGGGGGGEGSRDIGTEAIADGSKASGKTGGTLSVKGSSSVKTGPASMGLGCEEVLRGSTDDGDKVDGEGLADAIASPGGSAKQSVHEGSAKSVQEHEAAEDMSEDDDAKKAVDENDVPEESSSAKSLEESSHWENQHSGETEAKEAAEAANDDHGKNPVDGNGASAETSSAQSPEEEHRRETEAKEAAQAAEEAAPTPSGKDPSV